MGNGVYWTNWNNPQHGYWSRTYGGHDDGDTIFGGPGNDFINGNAGLDYLDGGFGNDTIYGGQNAGAWTAGKTRTTTIHLREGHDMLKGGPGDDFLNGNMGTDILYGGPGADHIITGNDTAAGDDHVNHVRFSSSHAAGDVVYRPRGPRRALDRRCDRDPGPGLGAGGDVDPARAGVGGRLMTRVEQTPDTAVDLDLAVVLPS